MSVAGGSVEGLVVGVDAASVGEVNVVFCVAKIGSVSDTLEHKAEDLRDKISEFKF